MAALHDVEHGILANKDFQVRLLRALGRNAEFEATRTIERVTGCELAAARMQMDKLPYTLPIALFRPQALRLIHELKVAGVEAEALHTNGS
jgi:hypothetical protein